MSIIRLIWNQLTLFGVVFALMILVVEISLVRSENWFSGMSSAARLARVGLINVAGAVAAYALGFLFMLVSPGREAWTGVLIAAKIYSNVAAPFAVMAALAFVVALAQLIRRS